LNRPTDVCICVFLKDRGVGVYFTRYSGCLDEKVVKSHKNIHRINTADKITDSKNNQKQFD